MEDQKTLSVPLPASLLQWYEERPTLLRAVAESVAFHMQGYAKANGYGKKDGKEHK